MADPNELFSHFASVLPVKNVQESINFYHDKLGFDVTFEWNDPVDYAVIKRGENVSIHLTQRKDHEEPSGLHTTLYVFVHDVDAVYAEFQARKVEIVNPIGDRDYRMRDFDIKDPDGYILSFGKGIN